MMGHLNSFLAWEGGFEQNFPKMGKMEIEWPLITEVNCDQFLSIGGFWDSSFCLKSFFKKKKIILES